MHTKTLERVFAHPTFSSVREGTIVVAPRHKKARIK